VLGGFLVVMFHAWERHGVTAENYARIKPGMTRAEVNAIFGQEPYEGRCSFAGSSYDSEATYIPSPFSRRTWVSIYFDEHDRVCHSFIGVGGFEWWERAKPYFCSEGP
jgi:hypothetical protein